MREKPIHPLIELTNAGRLWETLAVHRDDASGLRTEVARFVASKGSVAIDGISLTVNEVEGNRFGVNIIPHTQAVTTLGQAKPGQRVNLEVDMLARYVQRLLEHGRS